MKLIVLFLFITGFSFAQNYPDLIPYQKNNLWGYCDSNKIIKIQPTFKFASFFKENKTALVGVSDSLTAIINNQGNILFKSRDGIADINSFYFLGDTNDRYKLIDSVGNSLTDFIFNLDPDYSLAELNYYQTNYLQLPYVINDNQNWVLINRKGTILTPADKSIVHEINDSIVICQKIYMYADYKTYSKKYAKKALKYSYYNDSCRITLEAYNINSKQSKHLCEKHSPGKNDTEFFYYDDFYIDERKNEYRQSDYAMYDYKGNLIHSHLPFLFNRYTEIYKLEKHFYLVKDNNQFGLYHTDKKTFTGYIYHEDSILYKNVLLCANKDSVYKIKGDSLTILKNLGNFIYPELFKYNRYIDLALLDKTLKYHSFINKDGSFMTVDAASRKIRPNGESGLVQFKDYYNINFKWFNNNNTPAYCPYSYRIIETPYPKLFLTVGGYDHYIKPHNDLYPFYPYSSNAHFSNYVLFSFNGTTFAD